MSKDKKHHPAQAAPVPQPAMSEQELAALREKAAKADENLDRFLRAAAELENYRKRVLREKEELARATREQVVAALLPVLDNLERAITHAGNPVEGEAPATPQSDDALLDGLRQIHSRFQSVLAEFGLEEVVAHAGHPFDPNFHEAIGHVESAEHPEGVIVEQLQRGYNLSKRLLRPARVIVSKGSPAVEGLPAAPQGASTADDNSEP
jgi:molecular chaperone GrpE